MALVGLVGWLVVVEADIGAGLPRTVLVGLPDPALYQSRDRFADELRRTVLLGELGLNGPLRPVRGVLPATLAAQQATACTERDRRQGPPAAPRSGFAQALTTTPTRRVQPPGRGREEGPGHNS